MTTNKPSDRLKAGTIHKTPEPKLKPSPTGFAWPHTRGVTTDHARRFTTRLNELMKARNVTGHALATAIFGLFKTSGGNVVPGSHGVVSKWQRGESFPTPKSARYIAAYFDVSLADLMKPKGALMTINRVTATEKAKNKANGHTPPEAARLELPKGAKGATVRLETLKTDSRFMTVNITGTVQTDVALSIMALIGPEHH